ncbi:DUF4278 domain-containing protein [Synechococcus sp. H55.7]|uniref:DUF4278 domain-containing protein n=1 Tax=unclassified Synechococcus TaxID=2626047 RepID=UPI0039C0E112
MQLTYRGIAHEFVSPSAAIQNRQGVPARHRGLEWSWPAQSVAVALPQSFAFVYRGVALQSETRVTAASPEVKGIPAAVVSPQASSRKHFMSLVEETHRRNLLHRLQERIRSAQTRGDEHLLQQLEQERQLLA